MAKAQGASHTEAAAAAGVSVATVARIVASDGVKTLMQRAIETHEQKFADAIGLIIETAYEDLLNCPKDQLERRNLQRDHLEQKVQRLATMGTPRMLTPESGVDGNTTSAQPGPQNQQVTFQQFLIQASRGSGSGTPAAAPAIDIKPSDGEG